MRHRLARVVVAASVVAVVVVSAALPAGCFLLVSSGIRRDVPEGARPVAQGLVRADERVVAAWDGSVLQDGSLLVLLTDERLLKHDGEQTTTLALTEVQSIVVNEDDGAVEVVVADLTHSIPFRTAMSLPLRSSDERRAFARLLQLEVQRAKKSARRPNATTETPPAETTPAETPPAATLPAETPPPTP